MVFILFTRLPTGEDSAFILLVFSIVFILLLHAVVLLGSQIPIALSNRRWARRTEGISISRVWFLPLAQHLGTLILALLGLLGYFLVFSMNTLRLIHGVYVNMSPRMAVMVVGKVSSGLLQPVCRTLQVLMLAMTRSIL